MNSERAIVHMDLDTFFVSCERLLDSKLIGKPILIGGTTDRGVVASCSYGSVILKITASVPVAFSNNTNPVIIHVGARAPKNSLTA